MSEEKDTTAPPAPAKYSRYRSVRQQAAATNPPTRLPEKSQDAPISRSMSRYRRPKASNPKNDKETSPQSLPPVPMTPRAPDLTSPTRRATDPSPSSPRTPVYAGSQAPKARETEAICLQRKAKKIEELEEEQRRVEKDQAEQKRREEQQRLDAEAEQARLADERLAEQKRKDLERLEAELDAASPPLARITSRERFGFFTRRRAATKVTPPSTASGGSTSTPQEPRAKSQSRGAEQGKITAPTSESPLRKVRSEPQAIEPGGGGVVPGIDAPISAVNAGERVSCQTGDPFAVLTIIQRILIRCKQSSINLPITPETTPVDLIYSAANIMNQAIIPSTALLLESYTRLGLERRLRRYEHVRDVMNSWDRDTQNALILQNSDSPNYDTDLAASSVPRNAPKSISIHMYHSQKPGKWSKRYITLLSSGQIYIAKKAGAKSSDKDIANICHLSDFDIYTPTPQHIRKHLKPPKKYCHAIKSQQKTTMFLSTENFVHFFSTDDEKLAEQWYAAVQQWRSWYLVHKRGEGEKPIGKIVADSTRVPARPGTKGGPIHNAKVSVNENPYTIGSFAPLLDIGRFEKADPESDEEDKPRRIPFHLRNSAFLQPLPTQRERHPPPVAYRLPPEAEDEFLSSGLLGRTYSQRQRQQKERDTAAQQQPQAFPGGPSLLNAPMPPPTEARHRSRSLISTQRPETSAGPPASTGLHRSPSKRERPKPLLDFTPQFKEAPQWDKTGKGHGVAPPTGVPLVDVATTAENPLADIPKATLLRRELAVARPQTAAVGGRSGEGAFVKGGLISGF